MVNLLFAISFFGEIYFTIDSSPFVVGCSQGLAIPMVYIYLSGKS